jgi:hypothetical protein
MVGFAGGVALGVAAWTGYQDRNTQSLFSAKARRRLAALSRLSSHASVDSIALVREYVAWERHPVLRKRGEALLDRLVSTLG